MARRGEKKIDIWKFTQDNQTAEVKVSLIKTDGMRNGPATYFQARNDELNISIDNPNIDELRTAAEKAVKSALSLEFDEFFYIEFEGGGYGADRSDMIQEADYIHGGKNKCYSTLQVEKVWISRTEPKVFKRSWNGSVSRWWKKPGPAAHAGDDHTALIPVTDESRVGLGRIFDGFVELNRQLKTLTDQTKIVENLQILAAPDGRFLTDGHS